MCREACVGRGVKGGMCREGCVGSLYSCSLVTKKE